MTDRFTDRMANRIDRSLPARRLADRTMDFFPPVPAALKKGRFFAAGAEPRVAEMLRDPIVHLVMRRDRVSAGDVFGEIANTDWQGDITGMGDTVMTPLYQVLKDRGVTFKFFQRVTKLHLTPDKKTLQSVDVNVQAATLVPGRAYRPLVGVNFLDCLCPCSPHDVGSQFDV